MKAQRRAISRVLSQASGRSANSSRISSAPLNQCSGVTRRRLVLADWRRRRCRAARRAPRTWRRGEIDVVGGDQRQIEALGQLDQPRLAIVLRLEVVALQLDVEPARKGVFSRASSPSARPRLPWRSALPTGPSGPPEKQDQAGRELLQIDEAQLGRGADLAAEIGAAQELEQIAIARLVLHQNGQPGGRGRPAVAALGLLADHRQKAADDRLDAGRRGALAELERAEQIGPVGDRRPPACAPGGSARSACRSAPCSRAGSSSSAPANGRRERGSRHRHLMIDPRSTYRPGHARSTGRS